MIPTLRVNADELLQWARYLEDLSDATNQAIADGLNNYGEIAARKIAAEHAERGDLQEHEVYNQIVIRRATARNLQWSMDARALRAPEDELARPLPGRDVNQYRDQELVSIVMTHDARGPCEICEEAAARGPYTQGQIDVIANRWKDYTPPHPVTGYRTNLLHPNCRCIITPYANKRRLRVQFGGKSAPPELFTAKQLGEAVAGELRLKIKAVRKPK
jgi:hypothetical protein